LAFDTSQGIEDRSRLKGLSATKYHTKTKLHLCLLMCGSLLGDLKYFIIWFQLNDKLEL